MFAAAMRPGAGDTRDVPVLIVAIVVGLLIVVVLVGVVLDRQGRVSGLRVHRPVSLRRGLGVRRGVPVVARLARVSRRLAPQRQVGQRARATDVAVVFEVHVGLGRDRVLAVRQEPDSAISVARARRPEFLLQLSHRLGFRAVHQLVGELLVRRVRLPKRLPEVVRMRRQVVMMVVVPCPHNVLVLREGLLVLVLLAVVLPLVVLNCVLDPPPAPVVHQQRQSHEDGDYGRTEGRQQCLFSRVGKHTAQLVRSHASQRFALHFGRFRTHHGTRVPWHKYLCEPEHVAVANHSVLAEVQPVQLVPGDERLREGRERVVPEVEVFEVGQAGESAILHRDQILITIENKRLEVRVVRESSLFHADEQFGPGNVKLSEFEESLEGPGLETVEVVLTKGELLQVGQGTELFGGDLPETITSEFEGSEGFEAPEGVLADVVETGVGDVEYGESVEALECVVGQRFEVVPTNVEFCERVEGRECHRRYQL